MTLRCGRCDDVARWRVMPGTNLAGSAMACDRCLAVVIELVMPVLANHVVVVMLR